MKAKVGLIIVGALLLVDFSTQENNAEEVNYNKINSPLSYIPKQGWVNDPNGLVYVDGTYHLFYQHNRKSPDWDKISWGHATSEDLVSWTDKGVAVPYDSKTKEMIFSGSAVYDKNNTSGFGTKSKPPVVAVYTSYFSEKVTLADGTKIKKGTQAQSLAFSTDKGKTWKKYEKNPVIRSPPKDYSSEYKDFRDPKMFWYAPGKKWILVNVLSLKKKALFYSSKDLKTWKLMSEFTSKNSPDNIWECPDLFELEVVGTNEKKWVLLISTNPGGISGGSGMHYYIGKFDGKKFTEDKHDGINWLDWGSDFYAGVTWNNVDNKRYFIAWLNNWDYAKKITKTYSGGQGLVRELSLLKLGDEYKLSQKPVEVLLSDKYVKGEKSYSDAHAKQRIDIITGNAYEFTVKLKTKVTNTTRLSVIITDKRSRLHAAITNLFKPDNIHIIKKSTDPDSSLIEQYKFHDTIYVHPQDEVELKIYLDDLALTLFNKRGDVVFTELLMSNFENRIFRVETDAKSTVAVTKKLLSKS